MDDTDDSYPSESTLLKILISFLLSFDSLE